MMMILLNGGKAGGISNNGNGEDDDDDADDAGGEEHWHKATHNRVFLEESYYAFCVMSLTCERRCSNRIPLNKFMKHSIF